METNNMIYINQNQNTIPNPIPNQIQPTICLNMIVKNESRIITRLLYSVLPLIDSYCICDTGSTDNTVEVIETFFKEHNIRGTIVYEPFSDFGYNRTFALQSCHNKPNADYILLLDADMILRIGENVDISVIKRSLTKDVYFIFQGNDGFYYKNIRCVKNNSNFSYWGVTHEYLNTGPDEVTGDVILKEDLFIMDVGDGGSKQNKYERDITLLKKGLEIEKNNSRYLYYLANTYKDLERWEEAIIAYQNRIRVGGWIEETWQCYYQIGKCSMKLQRINEAIISWLQAYECFNKRIENLYEIVHFYRETCQYQLAYQFYNMAVETRTNSMTEFGGKLDFLFLEKDIYDWRLDYEYSIIAYYRKHPTISPVKTIMDIFNYSHGLPMEIQQNMFQNYKFYAPTISNISKSIDINALSVYVNPPSTDTDFVSSTPSFVVNKGVLYTIVRFVNYRVNDAGDYINKEHIESRNVISTISFVNASMWVKTKEAIVSYNREFDARYVGLEDMRLFSSYNGTVYYIANRGIDIKNEKWGKYNMVVEFGTIDTNSGKTDGNLLYPDQTIPINTVEKNWVLFEDNKHDLSIIYSWYPLRIGTCKEGQYTIHNTIQTPLVFQYIRGSTNGVKVGSEIWFIVHSVSYETRRFYYHMIVAIDLHTNVINRYTPFFTFEKQPVEYCLGFEYFRITNSESGMKEGRFLIGYSIQDNTTKYCWVTKDWIESMFNDLCSKK